MDIIKSDYTKSGNKWQRTNQHELKFPFPKAYLQDYPMQQSRILFDKPLQSALEIIIYNHYGIMNIEKKQAKKI
jgi:hypothetical protein